MTKAVGIPRINPPPEDRDKIDQLFSQYCKIQHNTFTIVDRIMSAFLNWNIGEQEKRRLEEILIETDLFDVANYDIPKPLRLNSKGRGIISKHGLYSNYLQHVKDEMAKAGRRMFSKPFELDMRDLAIQVAERREQVAQGGHLAEALPLQYPNVNAESPKTSRSQKASQKVALWIISNIWQIVLLTFIGLLILYVGHRYLHIG